RTQGLPSANDVVFLWLIGALLTAAVPAVHHDTRLAAARGHRRAGQPTGTAPDDHRRVRH
ncbi:hypothetical protein AB0D22_07515, partial [Kitasatospora sp. NPDC048538]|uniref:hypothetical protein n=1 Tax=Kitasatospora sp. NPDC048538 TaxID=3155633 RepID=UPI0033F0835C